MKKMLTARQALETNATICFVEPGDDGVTPVEVRVSAWEAVASSMQCYAQSNLKCRAEGREILQPDAETALEDYIVVHWATIEPFGLEDQRLSQNTNMKGTNQL